MKQSKNAVAYEKLGISNDFMFGRIMMDPKICKPFLESLLDIQIDHIEYLEAQKTVNPKADARSIRLDIYVDDGETVYNCEMQTTLQRNLPKRSRYYQGMIDINILERTVDYNQLKKSFVIFICTFDPFDKGAYVYTFRNTCKEYPDMTLGDDTYKIFFNTQGKQGDIPEDVKELLRYMQTSEMPEGCSNPLIKDMDHALQMARTNEEWRNDFMTLELLKQEQFWEGQKEGWMKGKQEGIREGVQEGQCEMAALIGKILTEAQKHNMPVDYSRIHDLSYINFLEKNLKVSM